MLTGSAVMNWVLVASGGALGAIARYAVAQWLHPDRLPQAIPLGTLAVNVAGSALLGWLFAQLFTGMEQGKDQSLWLLWGVGFCGAFTTMSTLSLETLTLIQRNHPTLALLNWSLQTVLCLGAAWTGLLLGKR